MALTAQEQREVAIAAVRADITLGQAFSKPVLIAAVAAADQWATDNAASFNTALNATFRTNATAAQKNEILSFVCQKRAGLI